MSTATKAKPSPLSLPTIGLAILVIIGIAAWVVQLTRGMSVIGINQVVVWGIYIAVFFTLAGLASGLVILAALSDFEVIPALKNDRRSLLLGALACYIASGLMILMDIGRPLRVLNFIFSANITSPFVWDFLGLALAVVLTVIYLFAKKQSKWMAALAAIVAALVVITEGWILSMSAGSPLWQGGVMPAVFMIEALAAAAAVVLIAKASPKASGWLQQALVILLPIMLLLNLFEIASVLYGGEPEAQVTTRLLLGNPLFRLQILVGIILPFVLLVWFKKDQTVITVASILVILGVLLGKTAVLVTGQAVAYLQTPVSYTPTLTEIGGVIGILALAGLLFVLGRQFLFQKAPAE